MNPTTNSLIKPTLQILGREAVSKNGPVQRTATVEFIDLSYSERARIWAHNHPVTAIVATIALAALLGGAVFAVTASLGLPLFGASMLAFDAAFIPVLCAAHFFSKATIHSKLHDSRREGGHYGRDAVLELKDFKRVAVILGPVRFREKLEAELLQEKYPFLAYSRIMARLEEMGGEKAFFGPLPKFKEYFLSKTQGLRCSEFFRDEEKESKVAIIDSKEMIFYLQESDLISPEEANCLTSAYEITERFTWLSYKLRCLINTRYYSSEPKGGREDLCQIAGEALAQCREKRDAALIAVDAKFENVRTKAL